MLGARFLDADFMRINLACEPPTVWLKGRSGCMERIAIAMQDGGTGAGAQHAARAARPTSFLSCHRMSMWAPPVGGTFWFQIFIQAPSLEIWRKTISGAEGGSGEEVGWPVLSYLLGKKLSAARSRSSR